MTSECNRECKCQEEFFIPTCGLDNLTYFSPCHAGCTNYEMEGEDGMKVGGPLCSNILCYMLRFQLKNY